MKKIIATLLVLSVAGMCLAGCGSETTSTEEASSAEETEEIEEIEDDEMVPAFPAEYDGCTLDVTLTDVDGEYVTVYATYTNDNEEPLYALCSFGMKAFQGGISLEDVSDINGDEASLIEEIKDGASIDVSYKFKLENNVDEIEVMAVTPTASQDILAEEFLPASIEGIEETSTEGDLSVEETVETELEDTELVLSAEYNDCMLNVTSTDVDGEYLLVYATYTNDTGDLLYALCSFGVKAFQNDIELEDVSDINGDEASLIKEVKDGASVDVSYKFKLENEDDEIEVMVVTPTANQDILADEFLPASIDGIEESGE